ncbi:MAG: restriction endonuclease subunit S [Bacteroidales bacterium]|nr:restriction endonuclease subunit S [Bacteroidales bacterium]
MKKLLKEIAEVQYGPYLKRNKSGEVLYLQVKDFQNNKYVVAENKYNIKFNNKIEKHVLTTNDIIIAAKGANFFAWHYTKDIGIAVASSSFFVIRIIDDVILPEYLTAILNHHKTQKYLDSYSVGSNIKTLKKDILLNFEIPVLSFANQKRLISFVKNWEKEKLLTLKILEKKQQLFQAYFYKKIENTLCE